MLPPEEKEDRHEFSRKQPVFRSGMNVAKSLAVERNGGARAQLFGGAGKDEKYAFLFEDDEAAGASSRRDTKRKMLEMTHT